jgi:hypothetical protein
MNIVLLLSYVSWSGLQSGKVTKRLEGMQKVLICFWIILSTSCQ